MMTMHGVPPINSFTHHVFLLIMYYIRSFFWILVVITTSVSGFLNLTSFSTWLCCARQQRRRPSQCWGWWGWKGSPCTTWRVTSRYHHPTSISSLQILDKMLSMYRFLRWCLVLVVLLTTTISCAQKYRLGKQSKKDTGLEASRGVCTLQIRLANILINC